MSRAAAFLFLLLFLAAGAGEALDVAILSPRSGVPVFGEVVFEAELFPLDEVSRVELLVDGRSAAMLAAPPFRTSVDVGEQNRGHRFEVVAESKSGEVLSAVVETPPFAVDLEVRVGLQQLYVTVSRDGRRVLDLDREDFRVEDEGIRQRLVTFERGDVPFTAILLVDASRSMRGKRLRAAAAGARAFTSAMQPLDQAKVMLFSDRILYSTPFSSFAEVLTAGLAGVKGRGGTSLNDHLYVALRLLERRQGRRLVVLLSDGIDVGSVLEMQQVIQTARRSRSLIYWIRLGTPDPRIKRYSSWRDAAGHQRELDLLGRTVVRSGGRIATLASIAETETAFAGVVREIREQYVLGYYPSVSRGRDAWHDVVVKVSNPGLDVRARRGYLEE